jgi:hypothetical protein
MKRAIVRRVVRWEENVSLSGRSFSWSRTEVHEITAECGHKRTHRGFSGIPKKHIHCARCKRGEPPHPIADGPMGVIDLRDKEVANQLARALLEREAAR